MSRALSSRPLASRTSRRHVMSWLISRIALMGSSRVRSRITMLGSSSMRSRMLVALTKAEGCTPSRLEDLPRSGVDLPAHEERDEHLDKMGEVVPAAREVVLVAAVGVAGRVGVVLDQVDNPADAFLAQAALC